MDDVINSQQHEDIEEERNTRTFFFFIPSSQRHSERLSEARNSSRTDRALHIWQLWGDESRGEERTGNKKEKKGHGGAGQNTTSGFYQSRSDAAGLLNLSSPAAGAEGPPLSLGMDTRRPPQPSHLTRPRPQQTSHRRFYWMHKDTFSGSHLTKQGGRKPNRPPRCLLAAAAAAAFVHKWPLILHCGRHLVLARNERRSRS